MEPSDYVKCHTVVSGVTVSVPAVGRTLATRDVDASYCSEHLRLIRLAALITGSSSIAEDRVQEEAFAKLYVRWARIDNPSG
jgi:DNA-directed RNA polymerase specialized sigma24 family protein